MTPLGHFRSLTSRLFPSDVRHLFVLWKKASLMLATAIITRYSVIIQCRHMLRLYSEGRETQEADAADLLQLEQTTAASIVPSSSITIN